MAERSSETSSVLRILLTSQTLEDVGEADVKGLDSLDTPIDPEVTCPDAIAARSLAIHGMKAAKRGQVTVECLRNWNGD